MAATKKWTGRIIVTVFVITLVGIGALFAWPGTYNINNGSMTPTIPVGTKVFTQESTQYEPGDVITFKAIEVTGGGSLIVTHRLVGFNPDGSLITQGDANDSVDYPAVPVQQSDIIGKVVHQVPLIGGVQLWMQANPLLWMAVLLFVVAALVLPKWGNKPQPRPNETSDAEELPLLPVSVLAPKQTL